MIGSLQKIKTAVFNTKYTFTMRGASKSFVFFFQIGKFFSKFMLDAKQKCNAFLSKEVEQ
jgi:hypothetical protein